MTATALGSVPTAEITIAGVEPRHVVLYFHGGVYALGSAALAADLASQIGRRIDAAVISDDYRLAPEHPYPAVDDAVAAYDALLQRGVATSHTVVAGESAGAGLAVAALVAARDRGLPMPAAALLMSPWADLTLTGTSMDTTQGIDPMLSRDRCCLAPPTTSAVTTRRRASSARSSPTCPASHRSSWVCCIGGGQDPGRLR